MTKNKELLADPRLKYRHTYTNTELKSMYFILVDVDRIEDIRRAKGTDKISTYFSVWEHASHDGTAVVLYSSLAFKVMDEERKRLGPITETSGHRSIPHNTAEGGVDGSFHLYGKAIDHKNSKGVDVQAAAVEKIDGDQNGLLKYNTFLHYDNGRVIRRDYR